MTDMITRYAADYDPATLVVPKCVYSAASQEVIKLTQALKVISEIPLSTEGGDWDEIEEAQSIARAALEL